MSRQQKEVIYAGFVRLVPLAIGFAAGKGWISGDDGTVAQEALLVIGGVVATLFGSRVFPRNREKLAHDVNMGR